MDSPASVVAAVDIFFIAAGGTKVHPALCSQPAVFIYYPPGSKCKHDE